MERYCLTQALYYEARGEGVQGQLAVADVILQRQNSKYHPDTICDVVYEPYQFSFVSDGSTLREIDVEAWNKADDLCGPHSSPRSEDLAHRARAVLSREDHPSRLGGFDGQDSRDRQSRLLPPRTAPLVTPSPCDIFRRDEIASNLPRFRRPLGRLFQSRVALDAQEIIRKMELGGA